VENVPVVPTKAPSSSIQPSFDVIELSIDNITVAKNSRPLCAKNKPVWMDDYKVSVLRARNDPLIHFALFSNPIKFEDAIEELKW
jgi:hypothetical protein